MKVRFNMKVCKNVAGSCRYLFNVFECPQSSDESESRVIHNRPFSIRNEGVICLIEIIQPFFFLLVSHKDQKV